MTETDGGSRDARRDAILRRFIEAWGQPDVRRTTTRKDEVVDVHGFAARPGSSVYRVATAGAAQVRRDDGDLASFELLMVLPRDLGGATFTEVTSFLLDVFAHGLRQDVRLRPGFTIAPTPLAPTAWPARALLFQEPLGEPEELATFHVDGIHVDLLWVVPIHESEFEGIRQHGLEWFYDLDERSEWSLADPHRPPLDAMESPGE